MISLFFLNIILFSRNEREEFEKNERKEWKKWMTLREESFGSSFLFSFSFFKYYLFELTYFN